MRVIAESCRRPTGRSLVFVACAALYWNLMINGNQRTITAAITPLLTYHGFYEMFIRDLT